MPAYCRAMIEGRSGRFVWLNYYRYVIMRPNEQDWGGTVGKGLEGIGVGE
jgi:hypothetical protein